MNTFRSHLVFALSLVVLPLASEAQKPPPPARAGVVRPDGPQPKITEVATLTGITINAVARMPNGRVVIYVANDSIFAYDLKTRQRTLIARGWSWDLTVSPRGDRIAYTRQGAETRSNFVWAIAVDPATGAPTGAAQRVATSVGDTPSFSPDGSEIAFCRWRCVNGGGCRSLDLAIIPATGGTERLLAQFDKQFQAIVWSADAKWVYVQLGTGDNVTMSMARVRASGGPIEHVLDYAHSENAKGAIDGRNAFFAPGRTRTAMAQGRIGYLTAAGGRGGFDVPPWATTGGEWTFGPPRTLTRTTRPNRLRVLDLTTGNVRDLPFESTDARNVTWSPDQKHFVLAVGDRFDQEVVLLNADGAVLHRMPRQGAAPGPSFEWTPDSRSVAYNANSGRGGELRVLSVATGKSRVFISAPERSTFGGFGPWRPDGKTILATYKPNEPAIVELGLDGSWRLVRDLFAEFPLRTRSFVASASMAVVELGDSTAPRLTPFVLVPLDGGAARPVAMPALAPGERLSPATGRSESWFAATRTWQNQTWIQVMSTGTDSTRLLRLPANVRPIGRCFFLPDGEHLLVIGKVPGKKGVTIYSLPLAGTSPRIIARSIEMFEEPMSEGSGAVYFGLAASPDGKQFAFFTPGAPTSHIYDVDLTAVLQLINKR